MSLPETDQLPGVSRRSFLGWVVAAPVLVTATRVESVLGTGPATMRPVPSGPQPANAADLGDYLTLAAAATGYMIHITVQPDGTVDFDMPREENGQGLQTGIAMIIADEMDVALSKVNVTLAPATPSLLFNQLTGGSSGIRTLWDPVRAAAALARAQLLTAAAQRFGVPTAELSVRDGVVHAPDGRQATYGELTRAAAARSTRPASATPKLPSQYRLIGTPVNQRANPDIVTGKQLYATDLNIPGALPTMVARPPTQGGTLKSLANKAQLLAMPGIRDVATLPFGVAIRGETFGQVIDAVNAVQATWNPGPTAGLDTDVIYTKLAAAAAELPLAPASLPGARVLEADFGWAYVNHAALQPNVAVADVRPDSATVWAPLQNPIVTLQTIANDLGLPQQAVTVNVIRGGGSFGRTLWFDAAEEAALISHAMGKPVKLMWHRTNDMRVGRGHPQSYHKLQAVVSGGSVLAYSHRIACMQTDINPGLGEIITYTTAKPDAGMQNYDQFLFNTTVTCPYNFGAVDETLTEVDLGFATGSWRSVYDYDTRGSEEMFVDEIAAAMGQDPVAFRLAFLKDATLRTLLAKVTSAGKWGRSMPAGTAQGVGVELRDKSRTACLVELDARDAAHPRVTRAFVAVDAGLPINPKSIEGQIMGGMSDAISVVLSAGNRIGDGLPLEDGWNEFGWARAGQNPIELHVFVMPPSAERPGGIGEIGVPTATGAIGNAYRRATGAKPRRFPVHPAPITDPTPPGRLSPPPNQPLPPAGQLYDY